MQANGIRLWLDKSSLGLTGSYAELRWLLCNGSDRPLRNVQVVLHDPAQRPDLQIFCPQARTLPALQPGHQMLLHSTLQVKQALRCALNMQVCADSDTGSVQATSIEALTFDFPKADPNQTLTIEVDSPALLKNIACAGSVHIKAKEPVFIKNIQAGTTAPVSVLQGGVALENLLEVQLCTSTGLEALDFTTIAAHWPQACRDVQLDFVDEANQAITRAPFNSSYRARIVLLRAGYLTLLAAAPNGVFFCMAPNTLGQGLVQLAPGTWYFPQAPLLDTSRLAPKSSRLHFGRPVGAESMLALLTPHPIWPVPFAPLERMAPTMLRAVLEDLRTQPAVYAAAAQCMSYEP